VAASEQDVRRVHTPEYVRKMTTGAFSTPELRTLEIPWSPQLREATWLAAGAATLAGRLALRDGCAITLSGGFHHAFADHGEGFCLVNDVAVAIASLRAACVIRRAAVLDLDVHQGNGTAAILGSDPEAFTVSLHQQRLYPAIKPESHLDVGLPDGIGDAEYLHALEGPLERVVAFRPDLLFYVAGADPFEGDRWGGLALTLEGLRERDRRVFEAARRTRVPLAVCLAGGYAQRTADTVSIHVNMVRAAAAVFSARDP
jgi:acetoin utilization deacetylase AcuC-like enzyme